MGYAEALDTALCWGWIDGQLKPCDAQSWLRRFSPRKPKSPWSRLNTLHAERLIREGRMEAAGLAKIDEAKSDGRWAGAYASQASAAAPEDLLGALSKDAKAKAFFEGLNKANRYAVTYRLETARTPEIRRRRLERVLAMMKAGETFH